MKKIVILIGSYYPSYSAVGRCMGNIADYLDENYIIYVICIKNNYYEKTFQQYRSQKIIRISTKNNDHELYYDIQINRTKLFYRILKFFNKVKRNMRIIFSKSSIDSSLVRSYLNALENLDFIPDILIPACSPFESIKAAINYRDKHLSTKIIPILFDKFSDSDTLHRFLWNKRIKFPANMVEEKKMMINSSKILYMTSWKEHLNTYFYHYINKSFEIEHPLIVEPIINNEKIQNLSCGLYKKEDIAGIENNRSIDIIKKSEVKLCFIFAGSLIKNYVEIDYFLKLIDNEKYGSSYRFDCYSKGSGCQVLQQSKHIELHRFEWIKHDELIIKLQEADILVSIAEISGKQVSSKIFEYMSLGKPILHIYYKENDVNLKYLNKYPLSLCIYASGDNIDKNIEILFTWISSVYGRRIPFKNIENIFYDLTPEFISNKILDD